MRKAYEASDGKATVREVADIAGVSKSAVAGWWGRWRAMGIGIELDGGRVKHLVSLKNLGLPTDVQED
jgi:transposase